MLEEDKAKLPLVEAVGFDTCDRYREALLEEARVKEALWIRLSRLRRIIGGHYQLKG